MDINEYRNQYIDEIRLKAEQESTAPEYIFIERTLNELEDIGQLNDPIPLYVELKNSQRELMTFDAYSYDEADGSLVLICSDFRNERGKATRLTSNNIKDKLKCMQRFINEAVNGNISQYSDASSEAINIANEFRKKIGKGMTSTEIFRFKFIIISNATLESEAKNISLPDFLDRPVELNVWTLERIYQTYISNSSEIIEIKTADFGCSGIPCLKADLGLINTYDAYLGIIPGKFLADIYLKYGSKLLQGNVRAFLSSRGKVNKGIRSTIMNSPENFFTFNNGVAIVARAISFSEDEMKIVIQTNGKLRGTFEVAKSTDKDTLIQMAKDQIKDFLADKEIIKEIYVPGKLVNLVIK